jgi:HEAT repeat protein
MARIDKVVVLAAVLAIGLASSGAAAASGSKPSPAASASPVSYVGKLKSADLAEVRAGLDDARLAGPKASSAVPVIVQLLRSGLPYPLAESALDTLGDLGAVTAMPTLVWYADHRDVKVRRAAVRSIAKAAGRTSPPVAVAALRVALSDADTQVRAIAATGLGSLKAKAAVPDLFLALDHHVYEAAVALGELCENTQCDELVARVGKIPFDVATTGLEPLLFRPSAEVSDDAKVAIVTKLQALGTHDVNKFLLGVQGRWPKTASPKVKRQIDASVSATMASPGGDS